MPESISWYERAKRVTSEAASLIDGVWHHSWYWPRYDSGVLNMNGLRAALEDCYTRRERLAQTVRSLDALAIKLNRLIQEGERDGQE